jgi:hypothetical protein
VGSGDWATYNVLWSQPNATIKIQVTSAFSDIGQIWFNETDSYSNGSKPSQIPSRYEDTDSYILSSFVGYHSLLTDFLSSLTPTYQYPIFLSSNLVNDDHIYPPTIDEPLGPFNPKINSTTSERILNVTRQVNTLNMTDFYIEYDRQSGILVKLVIKQPNAVNVTVSGTNIWSSASAGITTELLIGAVLVLFVIALITVIVIYRRRRRIKEGQTTEYSEFVPFEAFICYKRETGSYYAEHLKAGLERSRIHSFLDTKDIPKRFVGKEEYNEAINEAIRESKDFLLIMTAGFELSRPVKEELDFARKLKKHFVYFRHKSLEPNIKIKTYSEIIDIGRQEQVPFKSREDLLAKALDIYGVANLNSKNRAS